MEPALAWFESVDWTVWKQAGAEVMQIPQDWKLFLLAMLLLLPSFRGRGDRGQLLQPRYTEPDLASLLFNWRNHLNLARSAAGALILVGMTSPRGPEGTELLPVWVPIAIMTAGVLLQIFMPAGPEVLVAPVFYLSGLVLALPGYLEGFFAFAFGWMFALAGRNAKAQLPAMALGLALIGFFNHSITVWLVVAVVLAVMPLGLSVLLRRRLVYASRRRHSYQRAGIPPGALVMSPPLPANAQAKF